MIAKENILDSLPAVLKTSDLSGFGTKQSGKVRDFYVLEPV